MYSELDEAVLQCFVDHHAKLIGEQIVSTIDEAQALLEEDFQYMVVDSVQEIWQALDELGYDVTGLFDEEESHGIRENDERILEAAEVFDVGDGRYLIVTD